MRLTVTLSAVAVAASVGLYNCGEPAESVGFLWEKRADIPGEYETFELNAVGPAGVYGIARVGGNRARIIVYDGSTFNVDYETPPGTDINDVAFRGDTGYFSTQNKSTAENRLWRFTGGQWEEIPADPGFSGLKLLTPTADEECWMAGSRDGKTHLIKFDHGAFDDRFISDRGLVDIVYCPGNKTLFALEEFASTVWVTGDDGYTWRQERVSGPPSYNIYPVYGMAVTNDKAYFVVQAEKAEVLFYGVLYRTGAAGEGVYEVSYLGQAAPGCLMLNGAAFRRDDDAVAVGNKGGSIYLEGRTWTRELVTPNHEFDVSGLVADPRGGYWCLLIDDLDVFYLAWHP